MKNLVGRPIDSRLRVIPWLRQTAYAWWTLLGRAFVCWQAEPASLGCVLWCQRREKETPPIATSAGSSELLTSGRQQSTTRLYNFCARDIRVDPCPEANSYSGEVYLVRAQDAIMPRPFTGHAIPDPFCQFARLSRRRNRTLYYGGRCRCMALVSSTPYKHKHVGPKLPTRLPPSLRRTGFGDQPLQQAPIE